LLNFPLILERYAEVAFEVSWNSIRNVVALLHLNGKEDHQFVKCELWMGKKFSS
jgi:hypothetical protein